MPPKSYRPLPSELSLASFRFYTTGGADRRDQFLAGVLFSEDYTVLRAARVPYTVIAKRATFVKRTNSHKFILHEEVWRAPGVLDVLRSCVWWRSKRALRADGQGQIASKLMSPELPRFATRFAWKTLILGLTALPPLAIRSALSAAVIDAPR
jgi:hypothetical protein